MRSRKAADGARDRQGGGATGGPGAGAPRYTDATTTPTSFQLLLQDEDLTYDVVNNPVEIRDWRIAEEWPAGAKPVTRTIQYDDLYRVTRVDHEYAAGDDAWVSPYQAELDEAAATQLSDPRRAKPSPHVSFSKRTLWQSFRYDWLGNTSTTQDDAAGFYDRSLGAITNGTTTGKPYQLHSANGSSGTRTGHLQAAYDASGNLTGLGVVRQGPCLGGATWSMRFAYQWDEVGRLVRARRWDLPAAP